MSKEDTLDPAIAYVVIKKRAGIQQKSIQENKMQSSEETKQEDKSSPFDSNESMIWDVQTYWEKTSMIKIKQEILQHVLGSDKDIFQITDLKKILQKFEIQDEGTIFTLKCIWALLWGPIID